MIHFRRSGARSSGNTNPFPATLTIHRIPNHRQANRRSWLAIRPVRWRQRPLSSDSQTERTHSLPANLCPHSLSLPSHRSLAANRRNRPSAGLAAIWPHCRAACDDRDRLADDRHYAGPEWGANGDSIDAIRSNRWCEKPVANNVRLTWNPTRTTVPTMDHETRTKQIIVALQRRYIFENIFQKLPVAALTSDWVSCDW